MRQGARVVAAICRRLALGALAAFLGLALCEAALRSLPFRPFTDIRTSHYVATVLWPGTQKALIEPVVPGDFWSPRALIPGVRFSRRSSGARHDFTTLASPAAPRIGYRSNGVPGGDQGPVYGVCIGDSETEGAHVDDAETYASVLSRMSGKRFVNLGARGQGTAAHLARLEASGFLGENPKLIILQTHENDLAEDLLLWMGARPPARGISHRLRRHLISWSLGYHLLDRSGRVEARFGGVIRRLAVSAFAARIQREQLQRAHALAANSGAKLVILVASPGAMKDIRWRPDQLAPVLIVSPALQESQRIAYDGHWNREGHETAARALLDGLRKRRWL